MANYVVNGIYLYTTDFTSAFSLLAGDTLFELSGSVLSSTGYLCFGITMQSSNDVIIAGQVFGAYAIYSADPPANNSVTVVDGGLLVGTTYGVYLRGGNNTVTNDGTISAPSGTAIHLDYGTSQEVINDGTITGLYGVVIYGPSLSVLNSGTILADDYGVYLGTAFGETSLLTNLGLISGGDFAVLGGGGNDRVVNKGSIVGDVLLNEGDDTYDGRLGGLTGSVDGSYGNDRLLGGADDDRLDGGTGTDYLRGYAGDDTYVVDSLTDTVSEGSGSGEDTIESSISFDLVSAYVRADIENLTLTGTAANGFGNALANDLTGNAAANTLDGRAGADVMAGLGGIDTYVVDNAGDVVDESRAGSDGTDTVRSALAVDLGNAAQFRGSVERIELTGTAAVAATGNAGANMLTGNVAANLLTGGAGADAFRFRTALDATNAHTIADFDPAQDVIHLDNAVMAALGAATGPLAAAQFWSSTAGTAHDASDRIIYDTDGGALWYDPDGTGAAAAVKVATLDAGLVLGASDFAII